MTVVAPMAGNVGAGPTVSLKLLLRCHIQECKADDKFQISELSSLKDTLSESYTTDMK